MPARVVVIGTGVMGQNHTRVLREIGALAGVVDANADAARSVAQAHQVPALSLDAALADPTIDAVIVATPTSTHRSIACRALESGKHVLVEKPIAEDEAQAEEMIQVARKADRTLAVGHIERYNPAVRYAREALAAGDFGNLITITARRVSNLPGRIRDVGCILDLGIHDIDTIRYLVGLDPVRIHAEAATFTPGIAFEDHAAILLEFPHGVFGLVEVNWLTPMKVRRLAITGSKAFAEVDYITQQVRTSTSSFGSLNEANLFQTPLDLAERTVTMRRQEPLRLELEDFLRAAQGGGTPLVTGEDGAAVLGIAREALAAAKTRTVRPWPRTRT